MPRRAIISRPIPAVTAQVRPGAAVDERPVVNLHDPARWELGGLGVKDAAAFIAVSKSRLYELCRAKRLGFLKQDGKRKFPVAMLTQYLADGEG